MPESLADRLVEAAARARFEREYAIQIAENQDADWRWETLLDGTRRMFVDDTARILSDALPLLAEAVEARSQDALSASTAQGGWMLAAALIRSAVPGETTEGERR